MDTVWCFSFVSESILESAGSIIKAGSLPYLIQLITSTDLNILSPALRTIGNIVAGEDDLQTQAVIDAGVLVPLKKLLDTGRGSVRKETCWIVSNITAGTPEQIRAILENDLFRSLVHILHTNEFKIAKEACWAICNATSVYDKDLAMINHMVKECSCLVPLCNFLKEKDPKILRVCLVALKNILTAGVSLAEASEAQDTPENPFTLLVEEAGGLDVLFALQGHENLEISDLAHHVLSAFFEGNEEDYYDNEGQQDGQDGQGPLFDQQGHRGTDFNIPHGGFDF